MDAIQMLTTQHAEVEALFDKLDAETHEGDWHDLCGRLVDRLTLHAALEEEIFYPAVAALDGEEAQVDAARAEHATIARLLDGLRNPRLKKRQGQDRLSELRRTVEHHMAEEENDLMPRARHRIGAAGLHDLAQRMESRMHAGEVTERRRAAGGRG
ncbi:MAG: hemerythrin domain-containing protein [Candidatus Binatia bacterium]